MEKSPIILILPLALLASRGSGFRVSGFRVGGFGVGSVA